MPSRLKIAIAVAAVSSGLALIPGAASAASAATASRQATVTRTQAATPALCPDGWCGLWGTITANPELNIRSGPGTSYSINGPAKLNDSVEVRCYTTGTVENGDPYWDLIADTNTGVSGYGADTFIYTGGNINTQVRHC